VGGSLRQIMSHPVKSIDIVTPYKICGAVTDGYLWKEVNYKIFIRHQSSDRIFTLSSHPGKQEMYLIENYPLLFETNNISAQNLALQVRDYKQELKKAKETLREKEAIIKILEKKALTAEKLALQLRNYEEEVEKAKGISNMDDELIKHKDQIIANLMSLKIKKRKEVEEECIIARNYILGGKGRLVFKVLRKDLSDTIVSVKSCIEDIKKREEKIRIEKEKAVKAGERCANVIMLNNGMLQSVVKVLKEVSTAITSLDDTNKARFSNNEQRAYNLLLQENRLILSVLYDDTLRMVQQVVEGGGTGNNPKYGYCLSRKYPNRLAIVSSSSKHIRKYYLTRKNILHL
jgi:hypothetical protein